MKSLVRYLLVGLAFATTGLFAQAAVDTATITHHQQQLAKVVKKSAKKHKKHRRKKAL